MAIQDILKLSVVEKVLNYADFTALGFGTLGPKTRTSCGKFRRSVLT